MTHGRVGGSKRPLKPGDVVYFWRESKTGTQAKTSQRLTGWQGPAIVLFRLGTSSVWVSYGFTIMLVAPEECRHASQDEFSGAAVMEEFLSLWWTSAFPNAFEGRCLSRMLATASGIWSESMQERGNRLLIRCFLGIRCLQVHLIPPLVAAELACRQVAPLQRMTDLQVLEPDVRLIHQQRRHLQVRQPTLL